MHVTSLRLVYLSHHFHHDYSPLVFLWFLFQCGPHNKILALFRNDLQITSPEIWEVIFPVG